MLNVLADRAHHGLCASIDLLGRELALARVVRFVVVPAHRRGRTLTGSVPPSIRHPPNPPTRRKVQVYFIGPANRTARRRTCAWVSARATRMVASSSFLLKPLMHITRASAHSPLVLLRTSCFSGSIAAGSCCLIAFCAAVSRCQAFSWASRATSSSPAAPAQSIGPEDRNPLGTTWQTASRIATGG